MKKFLAALACVFALAVPSFAQVALLGMGIAKAQPDQAHVTLTVATEGKAAIDAVNANAEAMKKVCESVETNKVDAKDIRTNGFYVYPKHAVIDNVPTITGYIAVNSVVVTVKDIKALSKVIDDAIQAGANRIEGIRWDIADKSPLYEKAREQAFADAALKAQSYARLGKFRLGNVKSVSEGASDFGRDGPYLRPMADVAPNRSGVPLNPGEMQIQVWVNVQWNIEPRSGVVPPMPPATE